MKSITKRDIGISLLVATVGAVLCLWFWLACEAFPAPTTNPDGALDLKTIVFDDRPLIVSFNWYTTSKVLLFIFSFAYTLAVSLIARRLWRMAPDATGATEQK